MYNPVELSEKIKRVVSRKDGNIPSRKYYRFRGGRWYGGIATADCIGCNLTCGFCWSWKYNLAPRRYGTFYTPEEVFNRVDSIARKRGYRQVRVSGGEPTLDKEHLLSLLEYFEQKDYLFILETNGILIGYDKSYAKALSKFSKIHVRVSIKGASPEEFELLTSTNRQFFEYQIKSLENLLNYGVKCHPAAMLSFSDEKNINNLLLKLESVDRNLVREFEEEYVFLYPHVIRLMKRRGLKPHIAYRPDSIPSELI